MFSLPTSDVLVGGRLPPRSPSASDEVLFVILNDLIEKDSVRIENAIVNMERYFSRDGDGLLKLYASEMFLLGKEIYSFVGSDIKKLRNKIR